MIEVRYGAAHIPHKDSHVEHLMKIEDTIPQVIRDDVASNPYCKETYLGAAQYHVRFLRSVQRRHVELRMVSANGETFYNGKCVHWIGEDIGQLDDLAHLSNYTVRLSGMNCRRSENMSMCDASREVLTKSPGLPTTTKSSVFTISQERQTILATRANFV